MEIMTQNLTLSGTVINTGNDIKIWAGQVEQMGQHPGTCAEALRGEALSSFWGNQDDGYKPGATGVPIGSYLRVKQL